MDRNRGAQVCINYRELACVDEKHPRLPRKPPQSPHGSRYTDDDGVLYPIKLMERDGTRVLIHYVGYDSHFNEWREEKDLINMSSPRLTTECYDLHHDLALKIKSSLTSKRKSNAIVRVDMPFDKKIFCQGLQCKVTESRTVRGVTYYRIDTKVEGSVLLVITVLLC